MELIQKMMEEGNADRRRLVELAEQHDRNAAERHAKLLAALQQVDDGIEAATSSGLRAFVKRMTDNPAVQAAATQAAVLLMGALGTWAYFSLTGTPPTPTPMQLAQPIDVVELQSTEAP